MERENESLGERVARIFCREMPQEQNSQENLAALVDRLSAPAATGKVGEAVTRIRSALVMLELGCSGFRDAHLLRKEVYAIQSALPEIEASLSRLGASGKAGWTSERPTKPGHYWRRTESATEGHWYTDIEFVFERDGRLFMYREDEDDGHLPIDSVPGEWSGPIPVPEE